jgi:hypothetical protein
MFNMPNQIVRAAAHAFVLPWLVLLLAGPAIAELPDGWQADRLAEARSAGDDAFAVRGQQGEFGLLTRSIQGTGNLTISGTIELGHVGGPRSAFLVAGHPEHGWILAGMFSGQRKLTIQQLDADLQPITRQWRDVPIDAAGQWDLTLQVDMAQRGVTLQVDGLDPMFTGLRLERFGMTRAGFGVWQATGAQLSVFRVIETARGGAGAGASAEPTSNAQTPEVNSDEDYRGDDPSGFDTGLGAFSPVQLERLDGALRVDVQGVGWLQRRMPPLQAGRVYVLEMEARSIGQIERILPIIRGTPADDVWPPSEDWTTYRTQFHVAEDHPARPLHLRLRGVGQLEVRSFRFYTADAFDLPAPPATDRGELLRNGGFELGLDGWRRGHPNALRHQQHREVFGEWMWDAEQRSGTLGLPDAPDWDRRPIVSHHQFTLHHGKQYRIALEGRGGPVQVSLRYPVYGAQAPITYRTWQADLSSGSWSEQFTLEGPENGMLAEGASFYFELAVGPAAVQFDSVSLIEGAGEAELPRRVATAVALPELEDPYGGNAWAEQPLTVQAVADGVPDGAAGRLVVRDHLDQIVLEHPLTAAQSDAGQPIAVGRLTDGLPAGWYTLHHELDDQPDAVAWPRELAVIPHPKAMDEPGHFLGTHFRGLHVERGRLQRSEPERLRQVSNWGVGHQRLFLSWTQFDEPWLHEEVQRQLDAGLHVMAVISPDERSDDTDLQTWAEAVRGFAERYRGEITTYEVWNEPDLHRVPVERHVQACRLAYETLKAVDPQITVVAGAVTTSGRVYLQQSIEQGMLDWCDVVSFHGYVREQAADAGPAAFAEFTEPVRDAIVQRGQAHPIWDTEAGWGIPSGRDGLADARTFVKAITCRQAAGISRYYSYMAAAKGFPGGTHFTMFTGFNERPLITQPMMAVWASLLGDATFEQQLLPDHPEALLFQYRSATGEPILVGWTTSTAPIEVPLPPDLAGSEFWPLNEMGQPLTAEPRASETVTLMPAMRYFLPGSHRPAATGVLTGVRLWSGRCWSTASPSS